MSNSRLLSLALEDIAAYNDHGAALVAAIRQANVAPLHHPVILGMFAVWSLLVSIGHFSDDDVLWPPYTADQFRAQEWLDAGVKPLVVSIISLLPYPSDNYDSSEKWIWGLDPQAYPLSYLGSPKYDTSEENPAGYLVQWDIDFHGRDLIKPDHVRLTKAWTYETNYIYDTAAGKIIILNMERAMNDGPNYGDDHMTRSYAMRQDHFYPAKEIMSNWVRNIYDLVYVPSPMWPEKSLITTTRNNMEFDPKTNAQLHPSHEEITTFCNDISQFSAPWIPDEYAHLRAYNHDLRRRNANFAISLKKMYRGHGWPDNLDKEGARAAVQQFKADLEKLEEELKPFTQHLHVGEHTPEELPIRARQDAFLQRTAGEFVVLPEGDSRDELSLYQNFRLEQGFIHMIYNKKCADICI